MRGVPRRWRSGSAALFDKEMADVCRQHSNTELSPCAAKWGGLRGDVIGGLHRRYEYEGQGTRRKGKGWREEECETREQREDKRNCRRKDKVWEKKKKVVPGGALALREVGLRDGARLQSHLDKCSRGAETMFADRGLLRFPLRQQLKGRAFCVVEPLTINTESATARGWERKQKASGEVVAWSSKNVTGRSKKAKNNNKKSTKKHV